MSYGPGGVCCLLKGDSLTVNGRVIHTATDSEVWCVTDWGEWVSVADDGRSGPTLGGMLRSWRFRFALILIIWVLAA